MRQKIGVIDCGAGNLLSVEAALKQLGAEVVFASTPEELQGLDRVILPGVGAFKARMQALQEAGFVHWLRHFVDNGGYLLGICLGMQLLLEKGFEHGECKGLGLVKGQVLPLEPTPDCRVPHMGWNDVFGELQPKPALFNDVQSRACFYFVHSYYAALSADIPVQYTHYCGRDIVVAYQQGRVFGVQFHPEKSQKVGLQLLANFLNYQDQQHPKLNNTA